MAEMVPEQIRQNNLWLKIFALVMAAAAIWTIWRMDQGPAFAPVIQIQTLQVLDKTGTPVRQADYDALVKDRDGMRESYDMTLADYRDLKAVAGAVQEDWKAASRVTALWRCNALWTVDAVQRDADASQHLKDLEAMLNYLNEQDAEPFRYPEFDKERRPIRK